MNDPNQFLVPTNMLLNQKSVSSPSRFTVDASSLTNTVLDKGVNYLPKIYDVVILFRDTKIALSCDLKHFYHRIRLNEQDWKFTWFLHNDIDRNGETGVFEQLTVCMAYCDSVFLATSVLRKIADIIEAIDPQIAEILRKYLYLNDFIL